MFPDFGSTDANGSRFTGNLIILWARSSRVNAPIRRLESKELLFGVHSIALRQHSGDTILISKHKGKCNGKGNV